MENTLESGANTNGILSGSLTDPASGWAYLTQNFPTNVPIKEDNWHVTSVTDRFGNSMRYGYVDNGDGVQRLSLMQASELGASISLNYVNSQLDSIRSTDAITGKVHTYDYGYDNNGRLQSVLMPNGLAWNYVYTTDGSLDVVTHPNGGKVSYQYDTTDRLSVRKVVRGYALNGSVNFGTDTWTYTYGKTTGIDRTFVLDPEDHRTTFSFYDTGKDNWNNGLLYETLLEDVGKTREVERTSYTYTALPTRGDDLVANNDIGIVSPRVISKIVQKIPGNGIPWDPSFELIEGSLVAYTTDFSEFDKYGNPQRITETGNSSHFTTATNTRTTLRRYANFPLLNVIGRIQKEVVDLDGTITSRYHTVQSSYSHSHGCFGCFSHVHTYVSYVWDGWINESIDNVFNNNGTLNISKSYGKTTTYSYHANGEIQNLTDHDGYVATYDNYFRGKARAILSPRKMGSFALFTDSFDINGMGQVASHIDGRRKKRLFDYNGNNQLTSVETPKVDDDNYLVEINVNSITTTRGRRVTSEILDGFDRVIKTESFDSTQPTTTTLCSTKHYNALGWVIFDSFEKAGACSTGFTEAGTHLRYDGSGRVIDSGKGEWPALKERTMTRYLQDGNVIVVDGQGGSTTQYFKRFGDGFTGILEGNEAGSKPVGYSPGEQPELKITTDKAGKPLTITELNTGITRGYGYDEFQQLKSSSGPEHVPNLITRYGSGRIRNTQQTSCVSATCLTHYGYDAAGRIKFINNGSDPVFNGMQSVSDILYDNSNNLVRVKKIASDQGVLTYVTNEYVYDDNNNLTAEILRVKMRNDPDLSFTTRYEYDSLDNLATIVYPSGQRVEYAPDVHGRATKVGNYITALTYPELNARYPNQLTYAGGRGVNRHAFKFGTVRQIDELQNGIVVNSDVLTTDGKGTLQNINDGKKLDNGFYQSGYLRSSVFTPSLYLQQYAGFDQMAYGYDTVGNITSNSRLGLGGNLYYLDNKLYSMDDAEQGFFNYGHDELGSLSSIVGTDTYGQTTTNNIKHDLSGNLVRYEKSGTDYTNNYRYDSNNRLAVSYGVRVQGTNIAVINTKIFQYSVSGKQNVVYSVSDDKYTEQIYLQGEKIAQRQFTNISQDDSDGDGMPNKYELLKQMNMLDASDKCLDVDQNGVPNYNQYLTEFNINLPGCY